MLPKNEKRRTRYGSTASCDFSKMSTQLENNSFDSSGFQYHLPQIYRSILRDFRRTLQSLVMFNFFSIALIVFELVIFFSSPMKAIMLGALFLTAFSYFVLLFYYQSKKPEQLLQLREQFLQACRQHISLPIGEVQHHLSIAEALTKLVSYLTNFEANFYRALSSIISLVGKFSSYCFCRDVFKMKRLLLQAAIEEHLKQIRVTPTDLEVHASLASTYVVQSLLYRDPIREKDQKNQLFLDESFRNSARLAIEEFRILNHYAPNDPWVHEQLALGYSQLDMPNEELAELEMLLKLRPQDKEILLRLGILYFRQGMNAKGLQVYEELKQSNFKRAGQLIASYGVTV